MTDTNKPAPAQYAIGDLPIGDDPGIRILHGNVAAGWTGERRRNPETGAVERVPSGFRSTNCLNAAEPHREPLHALSGSNWETVCKYTGDEISYVLANGPVPDKRFPSDAMAAWKIRKREHQGGIPKTRCPADMVARGEVHESRIFAREILDSQPCKGLQDEGKPCPHYVREREVRRARTAAANAEREAAFIANETRQQREIAQQQAQISAAMTTQVISAVLEKLDEKKGKGK